MSALVLYVERAAILTVLGSALFVLGAAGLAAHHRGIRRLEAAARGRRD